MASIIVMSVTDNSSTVEVTLHDPIGPNNTWTTNQPGVLSANSGSWNQLTGAGDLNISGGNPEALVLVIQGLNTYSPVVGSMGSGIHFGDGGAIADEASVDCTITSFS